MCIVSVIEFGSEAGQCILVKNSLYVLKSSGTAFGAHLAETLDAMGYNSSHIDPDVWIQPEVKPNIFEYFE